MAGTLVANTINTDTGLFSTQNAYLGIAKAWVNYNSNAQTITNSFNVSSVTYNGTGQYVINLTTAMPNANYAVNLTSGYAGGTHYPLIYNNTNAAANTSSTFVIQLTDSATNNVNANSVYAAVFSS